jgi:hypothetical protein
LYYFGKGLISGIPALFVHGNIDLFNKAMQFSLFPRVMLLGVLLIMNLICLLLPAGIFTFLWLAAFVLCVIAILISVPYYFYTRQTLKALLTLPEAFFLLFSIIFRLKKANKEFIHTEHHFQSHL